MNPNKKAYVAVTNEQISAAEKQVNEILEGHVDQNTVPKQPKTNEEIPAVTEQDENVVIEETTNVVSEKDKARVIELEKKIHEILSGTEPTKVEQVKIFVKKNRRIFGAASIAIAGAILLTIASKSSPVEDENTDEQDDISPVEI